MSKVEYNKSKLPLASSDLLAELVAEGAIDYGDMVAAKFARAFASKEFCELRDAYKDKEVTREDLQYATV